MLNEAFDQAKIFQSNRCSVILIHNQFQDSEVKDFHLLGKTGQDSSHRRSSRTISATKFRVPISRKAKQPRQSRNRFLGNSGFKF